MGRFVPAAGVGGAGFQAGEVEDAGAQRVRAGANFPRVDRLSLQGAEVRRDFLEQLLLDQQVQGLDVQGRYLADVGAVAQGQAALHQGQVKGVIVHPVEGLFRADRGLEVEDYSPRGNLVAEQFGQLVAGVQRVAGRERQAV